MSTAPILKWDNGMSVGIEAIDNDHKNLIRIISELSAAIHNRNEIAVIGEIFERLEDYIQEHFSREEQLMVKCNFPDIDKHIEQHRKFTQKIPELKRQLLESEAIDVSEEVNIYLFDWLINHILSEDIKFAEPARKNGLSNIREGRGGLFKRFTTWLVNHTPLRRRVVLTSMLPIAFILFLSSIVLLYSYKELETHHALLEVSTTISTISDLTHSLQEERDLTAGYISSQGRILGNELYDQRTIPIRILDVSEAGYFPFPPNIRKNISTSTTSIF